MTMNGKSMSQPLHDQTAPVETPDGWAKLRSALIVAAVWTGIAALVEIVVTFVLVPRLPSSILVFIAYGRSYPPYTRIGASDLVLSSWIAIVVVALVIGASILVQRRGATWPLVIGLVFSVMVPWFVSATLFSVLVQLGQGPPATSMSGGTQALIFVANLVFAIVGVASVIVVSARRKGGA
jgi:hypothetical protein